MIAYLQGKRAVLEPTHVIVDCQGVGYFVRISLQTYQQLQQAKEPIKVHTYMMVREDAQLLYGFADPSEQQLFEHLISVSGVGGNTALAILSSIPTADLLTAIATEDTLTLRKIKGIGTKTAGRIVLELKDKLKLEDITTAKDVASSSGVPARIQQEALIALQNLGFSKSEVSKRIDQIAKKHGTHLTVEEIIRLALRNG